jgi:ankyrin repeat protein
MISDRFRWVYCQLDTLRRFFPSSIRKTLNELPTTLDDTYERTLEEIPKEKSQHAHRLFQCLVAAIRPLYVEELAEIFAIEFDQDAARNLTEGWRPENPEEAVLSACSTLIAVIDNNKGSKIVQFSHFSVKEFLTSDRLRRSEVGSICHYHIPLNSAHTILAQACLTVLLKLDEKIDKKRLGTFPLAFYAAQHWFDHAKYEDVEPQVQDAMEELFNSTKPYLASWVWIHDVDQDRKTAGKLPDHPSVPEATSLYYAASCGLCGLAKYLISTRGVDVNAKCGRYGTPLSAASHGGHLNVVSLLLDHGADVNTNERGRTPLWAAHDGGHLDVMRLLLERGATPDVRDVEHSFGLIIHHASCFGQAEAIRLLLQHNADVNAIGDMKYTPLHWASYKQHANIVQILLEHGADINALSEHGTSLFLASRDGHLVVARLLLAHGADVHIRHPSYGKTPFRVATAMKHTHVAELLLEHGAVKE